MLAYIINECEMPFLCVPGFGAFAKEPSQDTAAIQCISGPGIPHHTNVQRFSKKKKNYMLSDYEYTIKAITSGNVDSKPQKYGRSSSVQIILLLLMTHQTYV